MKRIILTAIVFIASVGISLAGPADFFSEKVKDFGVSTRGPILTHYFFVTNSSKQTVTMGTPRVSCGCTSAKVYQSTLKPGESTAVAAYMDTRRISYSNSLKSVIVYVPFLSPSFEEVQLTVQTVCRDDLLMSPSEIEMGKVKMGAGATASTKVTMLSDPNWKLVDAKCTGGFVKPSFKEVSRNGAMVTYEVTATLDPKCPAGNWTAEIWVKSSHPGIEKLRIPLTVLVDQAIAINPDHVNLNGLKLGESTEHRIQLTSDKPFKVMDIKGAGDDVTVETQEKDATVVQTLKVTVKPEKIGNLVRTLEVSTNHPLQKKLTIPLVAEVNK
ncbi:MAG: DUF1573 domain-containing protein [Gemmataceae bacterium]